MDKMTIAGIVAAILSVVIGYVIEGGDLLKLFNISSIIIVLGGTGAAVMISFTIHELKPLPKLLKIIMNQRNYNIEELITLLEQLMAKARKDGLLALENEIPNIPDPFIQRGIKAALDGFDKEVVVEMLDIELSEMEERHGRGAKIFESAGGFCPTVGIMGTVMHMIIIMGHLDEPEHLGPAIGAAFTATLYGVAFANLVFFPFSEKLKGKSKEEMMYRRVALEGVLCIQQGISPMMLRDKLASFVSNEKKKEILKDEDKKEGEEKT